ncbi:O-antigen ligase family protein [Candidatus Uhrbacteria bacterium]|nr:O-antigen ligase family protein [Candidatus Uhrbacteria bacterium]
MNQFFGRTFWTALGVSALLYALALVAYGSSLSVALLLTLALGTAILSYVRLERGLFLVFIELFSNPHGALITSELDGFSVSLRMALFAGVMVGWFIGWTTKRHRLNLTDGRARPFVLLGLAVTLGFVVGLIQREAVTVFRDGNAYLYLLYLLPILSVSWNARLRGELLQLLASGALWVSGLSLALLYVFTHFSPDVLLPTYAFFRDSRVAEITNLGGVYRVFIQSQVFTIIFGLVLLSFSVFARNRRGLVLLSSLPIATALLALSRSFWIGIAVSLACMTVLLWQQLRPKVRHLLHVAGSSLSAVLLSIVLIALVVLFPLPAQDLTGYDLALALKERTANEDDVAVRSRWQLLAPMVESVLHSPLTGQGFGASVTFITDDPRVREIRPDGTWTTSSMEWGWLELWLKMGILGPAAFLYAAYELLKRLRGYQWTDQAWLFTALMSSLVFVFVTHFFSPYLNHPIGLGFLLFLVPFLPAKKPAEAVAGVTLAPSLSKAAVPALTSERG